MDMYISRSILFVVFMASTVGCLHAQFSIGPDYYRPAGRLGRIFEQGVGITVEYAPANRIERKMLSVFGRVYRLTTHQDTLLSTYSVDGIDGTFGPGYEVYKPILYGELGMQATYRFIVDQPFSPFAVLAFQGFTSHGEWESVTPLVNESTLGRLDYGGGGTIGFGAEYELNRTFSLRGQFTHTFQYGFNFGFTRYWRIGATGVYYW
jgi:hypothetical protein